MKKHIFSILLLLFSFAVNAQNDRLGANLFGITVTLVSGDTFQVEGNYNDPSGYTTGNDLLAGDKLWTVGANPGDTCRLMDITSIVTSFAGYVVFEVDANGQGAPSTQNSKLMRFTPDNDLAYIPQEGNEGLIECISQYLSFQLDGGLSGGGGIVETIVAGTGINVNSTDPANPIITNINGDQPVILNDAGTVTVSGSYPTFTITGTGIDSTTLVDSMQVIRDSLAELRDDIGTGGGTVDAVVAGTGISVDDTDAANPIVTNAAPDQTVSLTGAGSVGITGTYPSFTVTGTGVTGSVAANQIAYGSGSGITGSSALLKTASGIKIGLSFFEEGAGTNSFRLGPTTANSSGINWSAIGYRAAQNNTSGNSFIAIGPDAGFANTTGSNWLAQGFRAAQNNTTGSNWLAFGFGAAQNNITGDGWVAIGTSAAASATGDGFLSFGTNAGGSATGSDWIAFGGTAARYTTGSNFVSIGKESMNGNTTGGDVVAVGFRAGRYLTGGFTQSTDYTNSVYIGSTTKVGANGVTNENVFGFGAEGNGSNTVTLGNTSVTATHLSTLKLRTKTTAQRQVGAEGLLGANSTTKALDYHNGTSFGRLYPSSDVTPTNGQIPVFNSTTGMKVWTTPSFGTMSSWTLAADTGTSATIDDAETVTLTGGEGIDTEISGNTVTTTLDLSEIPAQTALGGNEYFAIYDVVNGNQLTHIDTLKSYLVGSLGVYGGSGTVPNNTVSTLPDGGNITYTDENLQLNPGNLSVNTDAFEIALTGSMSIDGTIILVNAGGSGAQKITVNDSGIVGFSSDDRALINTQTANRAVMFDGSNYVSEFPLESTGGITRQTQVTAFELARGTSGERPSATTSGRIRQNTTTAKTEISNGSGWDNVATEDYVDEAITETNFTQNTDVAIFPDKKIEHFTLETTSGAISNTTLSLPTAGAAYSGYMVKVWSIDTSGSFDNEVTATTIQNGATTGSTITLGNFQATEISCIKVGAASYRWVVTNQY